MPGTQGPFFFPMAHFVLFVFTASTIFHLQQRLVRIQPLQAAERLVPAEPEDNASSAPSAPIVPSARSAPSAPSARSTQITPSVQSTPVARSATSAPSTPSAPSALSTRITPSALSTPSTPNARSTAPRGMWTINAIGRLGNQMGEYATLYALARMNGRPAFIPAEMHSTLAPLFRISLPVLPAAAARGLPWLNYPLHDWMEERYRHIPGEYVRLTGYPCSWTFYHHLRADILREFALHDHVREGAQAYLRGLRVRGRRPATYVGVHVRRGDYVRVMPEVWKGVVADRAYLQAALDRFRARHEAPVFVVTSNGMAWCRENIDASRGDVVFAGDGVEGSPAKDFALLTQCNHTVMTIGTFGIWAAYLAGGETVYLANYTLPDSPFLRVFRPEAAFLPEWFGIAADLSPLLKP